MEDEVKIPEVEQDTQPIVNTQQTRADRLREASSAPDFSMPEIRPASDFFSESVMSMDNETLKDMMRETGIYASTSKQVSTAIGNALMGMNQLGDEMRISYGNLTNYLTGSSVGDEMAKIAYDSITQRYAEMANREEEIGGIRSDLAQLAGGATSFLQLALEGIATAGVLPLAHIGVQEFGQGTYNDMKAYADEHDGSLKGYEPKGFDIAANTANALLQVGIEAWLGVGSPRFLVGASRGLWVEGLSGALQEGVQGALSDLTEAVKGNQDISILLDNAEDYLRDAIVGGILQGSLGAVTHHQNYARSVDATAQAIAKARGHEEPTAQDQQQAKAIIDAKERQEASLLTKEFKSVFDASTGEGQLQAKIASALKKAAETKELDLDTANETEMAQRIEQIATQETMNAMDFAREQNRAISDMELNDIIYKDGAIWLEGLTPQVGDRAVSYARVLAERQSGLAEVNMKLDTINQEIETLKKDLAEAKQQKQESRAQVIQARIDKQNAIAEKNRMQAQKLEAQTAKLEKQIANQAETEEQHNEKRAELKNAVDTAKTLWSNATGGQHVQLELDNYKKENKLEIPEGEEQGVPYDETDFFNAILDELSTTRTDIDQSKTQHFFDINSPIRQAARKWLAETEQGKRLVTDAKRTNQEIQTAQKNLDEFEKPAVKEPVKTEEVSAEVKPVEVPKREELARIEPKPVVRTSLKKERAIKKTQTGITRKLDADSKFVKVIDKPSNVDFSDGKEYEDSSKRYLLNKVVIKEQDGNLYFKLSGGRYTPTSYVVIENYVNTDPYEIFSAQVEEGKEIGDHFDRAVQDFYKEKGLWSLAEPVKLRSWEEYMKDSGQVTPQVDEASLEQYDPSKQYNKYDMVRVRTQSGEHIGVWDGERMTLHDTMEDAQDFIRNNTEREEADRQADERRATAQKEESEKQEKAFREGQGFVEMPYIIQLLKDNDMWEDLSLREKGNFNAIGSVMFSNGRIVNAFGNENSKKGTKVTQNTLDTIQKLRDKKVAEKKSLKQERTNKKKTLTREQVIENMTNGSDRFLKIIIPTEGNSFIAANKETLDKIDMFAQADFLQRAVANDKTTPDMIGEIFDFVENMPQGNYLSNVYYDIMVKPTTPTDVALKAKDKYNRAMVDSTTQEDWAGKTPSEIATEKIKTVFGVFQSEIKKYEKKGVITDTDAEEKDADFAQIGSELLDKELLEYIFMKYNFDPRVIEWIRDNPNLLQNNEEQYDSWEIGSGSNLVDILGEPLDYAPDGLKQIDIYDEKEPEFDYETTVYKMPQTQEEFENKVVSAMYKQTAKGLDLQETDLQDAAPNDDRTPFLFQGSISGKGDTARGGYDDQLKRIILGEKSDLSTIQHEFAHYWIQNNFKWARSGLASQDWLRRWRDVEEWLGIEPQDRLLSRSASEKFAKAYERYILEGKVAPELQWAFEGFQKAYQDIYDDLENEYFDLDEELAPEVIDWFNRNKEQSPKRLLQADEKKLEKALTLSAGGSVIEEAPENTIVMTEQNKEGDPVVYMGVKQSEVPAGDNLLVYADKTTASKLQQSAKKYFGDSVEVQQLATLDTEATLKNFKDWIARDRQGAWNAMMNPDTRPIYKTYLYKAFSEQAMNDVNLAMELANIDMAKSVRELGQAIQALNIRNESGFDPIEIIRNLEKSKGELSEEELNNSIAESGVFDVELSEEEMNEIDSETECKL